MGLLNLQGDELEGYLVMCIACYPEKFSEGVRPEYFENPLYQQIWKLFEKYKSQGRAWDFPILYWDGDQEIKRWIREVVPEWDLLPSLIPVYSERLKDSYRKRLAVTVMKEIEEEIGFVDPYEFQSRLNKKLAEDGADILTVPFRKAFSESFNNFEKTKEEGGLAGITTGIRNLDRYFNGFQPSRLYILAARPSMGKSALMLNFALNAARAGHSIYVHCLEESMHSFSTRAYANATGIDNELLQTGRFSKDQWPLIAKGLEKLSSLTGFINEKSNLTPEQICHCVRAQHTKFPLKMVFIDHLQEIRRKSDYWHHDISEAAGMFKDLAKDLKIPVLLISQLNRAVEQSADKKPQLSHLKESGDIEAKADVIMLLFREAYYKENANPHYADLTIAKNRDGRTGIFHLHWNPTIMKFSERLMEVA